MRLALLEMYSDWGMMPQHDIIVNRLALFPGAYFNDNATQKITP